MGSSGDSGGNPSALYQNAAPMDGLPIAGKDSTIGDPFDYGKFQNFLPDLPSDGSKAPSATGLTADMLQFKSPRGGVGAAIQSAVDGGSGDKPAVGGAGDMLGTKAGGTGGSIGTGVGAGAGSAAASNVLPDPLAAAAGTGTGDALGDYGSQIQALRNALAKMQADSANVARNYNSEQLNPVSQFNSAGYSGAD